MASKLQRHRHLYTGLVVGGIITAAIIGVVWARGFKPNFRTGTFQHTGLIVAQSQPKGAQVYLNGRLTEATDTNISYLDPGSYRVRIQKDGFTTWEKSVNVQADLATEILALLFPVAPQISPLTTTGAFNPTLSPDSSKVIYGVPGERGGLLMLTFGSGPFSLGQGTKTIFKNELGYDFSKAKFLWSPDSKQVIASFTDDQNVNVGNILVDVDRSDQEIRDISGSLNSTLSAWQEDINTQSQTIAIRIPANIKSATASATPASPSPEPAPDPVTGIIPDSSLITNPSSLNYFPTGFMPSPDGEKFLYKTNSPAGEGDYKVYNLKLKREATLPNFSNLRNIAWFPDSEHLVIAQNNAISIIETDGFNKMVVYSGNFEDSFVYSNPSGGSLMLLTALTQRDGTPPNLYAINLK